MVTTTTGRATDFITFTRTSNATVTDSNGFIKWAGHNLLTNSESFDASAWTKTQILSTTANATAAPDGTTTADLIIPNTTSAIHQVLQSASASNGASYTMGIFIKPNGYSKFALIEGENTSYFVSYNATGSGSVLDSSNATGTITPLANGWYYATHRSVSGGTAFRLQLIILPASYTSGSVTGSWSPDGTSGIYLWGAHLYRSDLGGMVLNPARGDAYYPTTPRNLLGWTESFDNAAWARTNVLAFGSGSVANAVNGPNGLRTADLLVEDTTASNTHFISQTTSSLAASRHVFSVYAKAAGRTWMALTIENWAAWFNLSSGTVGTVESGVTATITSVGDGWYRCAVYRTIATAGAKDCRVYLAATDGAAVYTGDGTSGIYLWGAQLSDSASLDAYSPVYGAAVTSAAYYAPRLDFDPVTLAARGLLVEELRTNSLLHTAAFDDVSWDKVAVGTASAPVVTANNATAPDGTLTADLVVFDRGAGTSGDRSVLSQAPSLSAGTYTQSVWLKAATAGDIGKQLALRNVAGGTYLVVTLTASWVRYERTEVWAVNNWEIANRQGITADTTVSAHVWGAQLEAGSFATSYIPNGSAIAGATRTADVASVSTQAFPYSSTAGSYVANFQTLFSGANSLTTTILTVDGSGSKLIAYIAGGAQNPGTFDGSTIVSVANDVTGSISKIGSSFDASGRSFCANGSTVATGTVAAGYGSGSAVNIGGTLGTGYINGWFRQLTYIPRRLSSSELQARTV